MRTEWVIHIWGKERDVFDLTPQEKFHMDMIRSLDHSIFDKVLVNIALHDINDDALFNLAQPSQRKILRPNGKITRKVG